MSHRTYELRRTCEIALELRLAGEIRLWPGLPAPLLCRRRMQRPRRIGEMRARNRAEIGASRSEFT
jgi:hypothetical protein